MIKAIVAADDKLGIATDKGIPWDLPTDKAYFREQTTGSPILMGYRMYQELEQPLPDRQNLVAVRPDTQLRPGFFGAENITALLDEYQNSPATLWIVGGAALYQKLLDRTQTIYITRVQGDFSCSKFFPSFEEYFKLMNKAKPITENGLTFHYEVWERL